MQGVLRRGQEMEPSTFNEYAFINLCANGQIDNLGSLLSEENRYTFSPELCKKYKHELEVAAQNESQVISSEASNTDWRYRISRWMLRATDEFSISRETAIIALSYCDRYLMTKKITRHLFQVVAVCSLFFASKLFEKRHIQMSALMNYTQGKFDRAEFLSIEKELVISLASFSYPPIASTFCLMFLSKFPSTIQSSMPAVADTCQFMIELAACDSFFITHKQSRIALAAAVVAMEQMNMPTELLQKWLSNIKSSGINFDLATNACLKQLRCIYNHNQMRIQALDGGITTIAAANSSQNDRKRVCRAATPSPTPEDQPELKDVIASGGTKFSSIADDCIDGDCNQRDNKRQRYEV